MNKEKIRVSVRDSFWFLPALYSVLSIISVSATSVLDFWLVPQVKESLPKIFLTEKSVAQTLYGSLITSILTMTTISFSTIMVVLTTYTTQFSPRTLQDFMKSRVTQHVLGVYSYGFIFALINLLLLGKDQSGLVTPTLTVIVSIICLAFFIIFIHHSSRFVQVNNLIGQIRKSTSGIIEKTFTEKDYNESVEWDQEEINRLKQTGSNEIRANQSGYLQGIQYKPFLEWARSQGVVMEANFNIGDYIQKGMPIFYYWQLEENQQDISPEECIQYILIGNERTDIQDIEFSIQKLVEISVKAISPGINDPHTAVNCINRIGSLLAELASVYQPLKYYLDQEESLRLIMEPRTFQDYLYKSFYQIRIYGNHDISVMNGVLEALYKISVVNDKNVKEEVWRFGKYMMKAIDSEKLDDLDQKYYQEQAKKLAAACDQPI
ncbi:DUF2254 domain-containing protein [Halobacillus sp. BBL2006]|uniref:DUF2254 domain-containing protein n=1 Tax=Halobacillus sp. BBL2006 TaxID=1543706 RepID=UPI0005426156|nr:DUF2254 domain-containing protein [Halobacillus sp. BBL2006]KHE71901.1 hypothetical protein LD39_07365 [Halobacillus sp. BBL2006]